MTLPFSVLPYRDGSSFMVRSIRFQSVAEDTTPDAFTLPTMTNQTASQWVELETPVTVSGLSESVAIVADIDFSQSDGSAALSHNGAAWIQGAVVVRNGDAINLRVLAPDEAGQYVRVTLRVGEVSAVWFVATSDYVEPPQAVGFVRALYAAARTRNALAFGFTPSRDGTYRLVLTPTQQSPTAADVLQGQGQGGAVPVADSGVKAMTGGLPVIESITGLVTATAYRASVVLSDEDGGTTPVSSVTAMTTAAIAPQVDGSNRLSPLIGTSLTPHIAVPAAPKID